MPLVLKSEKLILKKSVSGIQTSMPTLHLKNKWSPIKNLEISTRHGQSYKIKTKEKNSIRAPGTMDKEEAEEDATTVFNYFFKFI